MKNKLLKFSDDELYAELNRRKVDTDACKNKVLNINGFTAKDIVCMRGGKYDEDEGDDYGPYYHFYLRVDEKLFDVYYMNCVTDPYRVSDKTVDPSRWPESDDGEYNNNACLEFIPNQFAEAMENSYEYHGETDVKKYLKKHGILDYRIWNPELVVVDGENETDNNYNATVGK